MKWGKHSHSVRFCTEITGECKQIWLKLEYVIYFLASMDRNSVKSFEVIVIQSVWHKDNFCTSLFFIQGLDLFVFFQSNVCSTKLNGCASPHRWWKADSMMEIPEANIPLLASTVTADTVKSQEHGSMNLLRALWPKGGGATGWNRLKQWGRWFSYWIPRTYDRPP